MDAQSVEHLQQTHLIVWNEKSRTKRDSLIATIYAENIKMYDKDFILTGRKEISDFIDKLFAGDPNFHFAAAEAMLPVQYGIRFPWTIQTGGQLLKVMDFFVLELVILAHMYVFLDACN